MSYKFHLFFFSFFSFFINCHYFYDEGCAAKTTHEAFMFCVLILVVLEFRVFHFRTYIFLITYEAFQTAIPHIRQNDMRRVVNNGYTDQVQDMHIIKVFHYARLGQKFFDCFLTCPSICLKRKKYLTFVS